MTLAALDRVKLTAPAAATFPDLAGRDGVVLRVESGWAVVQWRNVPGETRVPADNVEIVK